MFERRNIASLRTVKFEIKQQIYNERSGEEFHHWELRVKAALRGKDLIAAIEGEVVENIVTQKALSIVIPCLGENLQKSIQDCETADSAWIDLRHQFAQKSTVNELSA